MKIIITEEQKKKLFIPRKLSGEESRWADWNKMQPIVDGVRINQYDINTGIKQGYWEKYHSNGQLNYKGSFINGKYDGLWEVYYENGLLYYTGMYKNGKYDGIWEYYYPDGELMFKALYKDGKRIESLKESEEPKKGKLFIPRRLSGENSRFIQWNKEQPIVDNVQINQYTHDGKKTGIWESYRGNGNLYSKGSYKNGLMDGYWEEYYPNGQLWIKGFYINGERDGIWEEYRSNGQLRIKGSFKNGKQDGIWEEYYSNGQLYSKGSYKNGKKLPLTESEEQKKKLFIPRNIDQRKIDANKIKQKYISEIKEIIEEEGLISMGELGGDSIIYGYATEYGDEIALIQGFYSDYVEVVVYGGYKYNTEETSFPVKYEELDLDVIMKIRELLETYDAH